MHGNVVSSALYEGKVRARVCGILIQDSRVLLLKHLGIGAAGYLWAPPGGGIDFGLSAEECLKKEFAEETGLKVSVSRFLLANEYRGTRHHAIELFFEVRQTGGVLQLGTDPEVPASEQILTELAWFTPAEIQKIPFENLHNAFHQIQHPLDPTRWSGFISFANISVK